MGLRQPVVVDEHLAGVLVLDGDVVTRPGHESHRLEVVAGEAVGLLGIGPRQATEALFEDAEGGERVEPQVPDLLEIRTLRRDEVRETDRRVAFHLAVEVALLPAAEPPNERGALVGLEAVEERGDSARADAGVPDLAAKRLVDLVEDVRIGGLGHGRFSCLPAAAAGDRRIARVPSTASRIPSTLPDCPKEGARCCARALSLIRTSSLKPPRGESRAAPESPRVGPRERTRSPYALAIQPFSGMTGLPPGAHLRYCHPGPNPR